MANRIYISIIGTEISFSTICTEDISIQAQSQFTRIGDLMPSIASLASVLTTASATIGGEVSTALSDVTNALDVPLWQKTEPVKITTDLNFFIKTSGYEDVWKPTMILQSMNILSKTSDNKLITPGVNLTNISDLSRNSLKTTVENQTSSFEVNAAKFRKAAVSERLGAKGDIPDKTSFSTSSKLCSVYIPGIVYLPIALVEVAQPTWSKQKTDLGYPLWSKVNVQFTGLYPAIYEDNFGCIDPDKIGTTFASNL